LVCKRLTPSVSIYPELRHTVAGETQRYALRQGHDFLFLFERHCRVRDIDPQAVYAALGGLPALEPEGETVAQGKREG